LASPTTRQARSADGPEAEATGEWITGAAEVIGAGAVLMKGGNLALKLSCVAALYSSGHVQINPVNLSTG
jgi:hypothetical protein